MSDLPFHVGIVGGGLGGLTAAIAICRAGARVTVLEQASQLGEIGAGIQMFGNVSRFLVRTGVDRLIGDNLVQHDEVRNWVVPIDGDVGQHGGKDGPDPMGTGRLIGKMYTRDVVKDQGFPWWVVRRDHLHAGLAEGARQHGADIVVDARVKVLGPDPDNNKGVRVVTEKGGEYRFDLVIGADGINSVVRRTIFPHLKPQVASRLAAYRAVVPYETVFSRIPEARAILGNTMDAWSGPDGYVLLYPLSGGRELNVVTSHLQDHDVTGLEEPSLAEFKAQYEGFPPFVRKILDLVPETKRWPLLVVPPTKTWSNERKNIVLMGDAIHGMQNHMAQGAATSMEDGIFLGRVIGEVLRETISLDTAVTLYESKRIPRVWHKQQSALCQGEMWTMSDPVTRRARDDAEFAQVAAFSHNPVQPMRRGQYDNINNDNPGTPPSSSSSLPPTYRSTMLFMNPWTVPSILYYDAESDADFAVGEWLMNQTGVDDPVRLVSSRLMKSWSAIIRDNGVKRWADFGRSRRRRESTGGHVKAKL